MESESTCLQLFEPSFPVSTSCLGPNKIFSPPSWTVPLCCSEQEGFLGLHVIKETQLMTTLKIENVNLFYLLFGRDPLIACSKNQGEGVTLSHPSVSRSHASLVRSSNGVYYLIDLGSAQGSFVNDIKIDPFVAVPLVHGSALRFGMSLRMYILQLKADEEDSCRLNTLLNTMVRPTSCPVLTQPKAMKLIRSVSFSCLAPERIVFNQESPLLCEDDQWSPPETKLKKSPKINVEDFVSLDPSKRFRRDES